MSQIDSGLILIVEDGERPPVVNSSISDVKSFVGGRGASYSTHSGKPSYDGRCLKRRHSPHLVAPRTEIPTVGSSTRLLDAGHEVHREP